MSVINAFPGYEYKLNPKTGKMANMYRGTDLGRGGYIFQIEGMYTNVAVVDVQSMHPNSIINMNYFGEYTGRYKELIDTRIAIKNHRFDDARKAFGGAFAKYLNDEASADGLASALKLAANSCYGLTSASFENAFKDYRNVNNIVALRGALFMRTLQDEIRQTGHEIFHIRTDSAKIADADKKTIDFCIEFGKKYGYSFDFESVYSRMCLVDKTNYVAKYATADECMAIYGMIPKNNKKHGGEWTVTGAKFAHPFVFKTLFTKETILDDDLCSTKEVKDKMYLDMNEGLPDVSFYEDERKERDKEEAERYAGQFDERKSKRPYASLSDEELDSEISKGHDYRFIGRFGDFVPVLPGSGGGLLVVKRGDNKYDSVTGTKNYRWLESDIVRSGKMFDRVDMGYFRSLVDDAKEAISKYGDFEWFANNDDPPSESNHPLDDNDVPWLMPCKDPNKTVCEECSERETCPYISADGVIPWLCEDRDPLGNNCVDCPNQGPCLNQMRDVLDKEASEQFIRR